MYIEGIWLIKYAVEIRTRIFYSYIEEALYKLDVSESHKSQNFQKSKNRNSKDSFVATAIVMRLQRQKIKN